MYYIYKNIKCPCGSDKELIRCHGIEYSSENIINRIEFVEMFIARYQDRNRLTGLITSKDYEKCRNDFAYRLFLIRKTCDAGIRNGEEWHKGATFGLQQGQIKPINLPPSLLIYIISDLKIDTADGGSFISKGLYQLDSHRWTEEYGTLKDATIRILAANSGMIRKDNRPSHEEFLDVSFLWQGISSGFIVVKSALVLNYEVWSHVRA